jgi:hypothetical protein
MSVLLSWHEKVCISLFPIKLLFPILARYKDAPLKIHMTSYRIESSYPLFNLTACSSQRQPYIHMHAVVYCSMLSPLLICCSAHKITSANATIEN